jgi:glycerate dehydrogenase
MKVLYYPTSGKPHSDRYEADTDLDSFLSRCDVVSVHCPLNERTNGLIGYGQLARMKRSAVIVNMGRGGIVVEADLARALDEGLIAGAATDVFTKEPLPSGHPYLKMQHRERLLLTPHIGWASREARICLVDKIAANIKDIFNL